MSEPTFQQLTDQVQRLTQRVAALEKALGMTRSVPELETKPAAAEPLPIISPVESKIDPPVTTPRAPDLESRVGLRLVNRVGAITLILGIAFFFRYAVDKNLIGETARVLLGIAAGLCLLAGGEFAFRRDQRVFAQGITGAGAAVLYLSIYAAFDAYHLIPLVYAFSLLIVVTAAAGLLALRYEAQTIAILALFGGFLSPLLLQGHSMGQWTVPLYIAALDAGFLALASNRNWRLLEWLALTGTAVFSIDAGELPTRAMLPVYYGLFATRPSMRLFAASHALFIARATFLPDRLFVYVPELLGMTTAGLAIVRWRGWHRYSAFLVTVAGLSWFAADSDGKLPLTGALISLTILFAMFSASAFLRTAQNFTEVAAVPLSAIFYFAACYARLSGRADSAAALLALALAGFYFAMAYRLRELPMPNLAGMVSAGLSVGFLTLAIPIEFRAFRITAAWALEGAALVWIAAKRGISTAQMFGLFVLGCAVIHFAISDLTMYPTAAGHAIVLNARFVTALGVAAALFLAALWSRGTPVPPSFPGVAGHLVILAALAAEVFDWAAVSHAGNQTNVASAAVSILFAAYAVLLVAFGTGTRTVGNRYVGLVLIALVVVKLYLYDVWQLDMVYRFIAFAALGALLLTMSFVYSRYRDRIASWLKTDEARPPSASATHPPLPPE